MTAHNQTPASRDGSEPRPPSGRRWPILVVGLLVLNIGVCVITITAATLNPARIEPDYYDKAVNWDTHRGITAETQAGQPEVPAADIAPPDGQPQEEHAP